LKKTIIAGVLTATTLTGCVAHQSVPGSAHPDPAAVASLVAAADRQVCIDLDARGGAFYHVLVIPMMTGASGYKSVDVNPAQLSEAVTAVTQVGATSRNQANAEIADETERMVAAARAMDIYPHADATSLLTAFVGLSVACQEAGHKPSWFDANALATS
jgi:hypothetical protein